MNARYILVCLMVALLIGGLIAFAVWCFVGGGLWVYAAGLIVAAVVIAECLGSETDRMMRPSRHRRKS